MFYQSGYIRLNHFGSQCDLSNPRTEFSPLKCLLGHASKVHEKFSYQAILTENSFASKDHSQSVEIRLGRVQMTTKMIRRYNHIQETNVLVYSVMQGEGDV